MVYNGTVYLYAGHDEDDAPEGMGRFVMRDWRCYTTTDMVNWTDHGVAASLKTFPWAVQDNGAWAPQVFERNGKFYLYAPININGWPTMSSPSPWRTTRWAVQGRLGKPLIDVSGGYIDPTILLDDDGQAYLYWGNPNVWYVKLNPDMISIRARSSKTVRLPKSKGRKTLLLSGRPVGLQTERPYYMAYASTCCRKASVTP